MNNKKITEKILKEIEIIRFDKYKQPRATSWRIGGYYKGCLLDDLKQAISLALKEKDVEIEDLEEKIGELIFDLNGNQQIISDLMREKYERDAEIKKAIDEKIKAIEKYNPKQREEMCISLNNFKINLEELKQKLGVGK